MSTNNNQINQYANWCQKLKIELKHKSQVNVSVRHKNMEEIINKVIKDELNTQHFQFYISDNDKNNIRLNIEEEIDNWKGVEIDNCKNQEKQSFRAYQMTARNWFNRNKAKIYGNHLFYPLIFNHVLKFCWELNGLTDYRKMIIYINIFERILHGKVQYPRTKKQPLITHQSLMQPNKFKKSCIFFMNYYSVFTKWILAKNSTNNQKKDKTRAKKIHLSFINCLGNVKQALNKVSNDNQQHLVNAIAAPAFPYPFEQVVLGILTPTPSPVTNDDDISLHMVNVPSGGSIVSSSNSTNITSISTSQDDISILNNVPDDYGVNINDNYYNDRDYQQYNNIPPPITVNTSVNNNIPNDFNANNNINNSKYHCYNDYSHTVNDGMGCSLNNDDINYSEYKHKNFNCTDRNINNNLCCIQSVQRNELSSNPQIYNNREARINHKNNMKRQTFTSQQHIYHNNNNNYNYNDNNTVINPPDIPLPDDNNINDYSYTLHRGISSSCEKQRYSPLGNQNTNRNIYHNNNNNQHYTTYNQYNQYNRYNEYTHYDNNNNHNNNNQLIDTYQSFKPFTPVNNVDNNNNNNNNNNAFQFYTDNMNNPNANNNNNNINTIMHDNYYNNLSSPTPIFGGFL